LGVLFADPSKFQLLLHSSGCSINRKWDLSSE